MALRADVHFALDDVVFDGRQLLCKLLANEIQDHGVLPFSGGSAKRTLSHRRLGRAPAGDNGQANTVRFRSESPKSRPPTEAAYVGSFGFMVATLRSPHQSSSACPLTLCRATSLASPSSSQSITHGGCDE